MNDLAPLQTLFDLTGGETLPLPATLRDLYGTLRLPLNTERPYVIANFVTTLDGVVAMEGGGGRAISGNSQQDRAVMGLLRAAADAVIVASGTLHPDPKHLWTAESVFPPLADEYRELRRALGKSGPPLNVIVTASGNLDPSFRVFHSGEVPVLVVTTREGERRIRERGMPDGVRVVAARDEGMISAREILDVVERQSPGSLLLVEGGPHLMGDFFGEHCLDELFLTLAPQVAGRDEMMERPGLVAGRRLAPEHPRWGTLVSVKSAGSHLFLRYGWAREP